MRAYYLFPMLVLPFVGCSQPKPGVTPSVVPVATPVVPTFEEVTEKAGIRWVHNPCRTGHKYLPETVGGGGGFVDYDRDGLPDLVLINGAPLPGYKGERPHCTLYRNNGDGTFTDVTTKAGFHLAEYGMAAAVGDYDNDGWPDLFITAVGRTHLFHNEHGRFVDVTERSHTGVAGFTTAACWFDYDRDGRLDLYVGRYVEWTPQTDLPCGPENARQYCAPHQYHAAAPVLLHQKADGTFEDATQASGVARYRGKTLGLALYDFNHDGWLDLCVANDTEPDLLLMNNQKGGFNDQGIETGVALGSDATPTGSMGIDVGTPFLDGRCAIAVGVFAGQQMSLFVAGAAADGALFFENRKEEAKVAAATAEMTTFGLLYADLNSDGWPDIVTANGHIDEDPSLRINGEVVPYRQVPQVFVNQRNGAFREVGQRTGLTAPFIGRGLAVGDYDNDGRPDLLVFENGGSVHLYHNTTERAGDWLGLELRGKRMKDPSGAMVTLSGDGWSQTGCVTTTRSYLSCCDPRVLTGIPSAGLKDVQVRWPSGETTTFPPPERNRYTVLTEP